MATRDNLPIIRAARTGAAAAQLMLGSRYFFGKSGLPQSTGTAFYWLERAARQGLDDAFVMIGRHVPYDLIATMPRPYEAAHWYERAFDAGISKAGLIFARLVFEYGQQFGDGAKRKALDVLKLLAEKEDHAAQWMLAQHLQKSAAQEVPEQPDGAEDALRIGSDLARKAARAGVEEAQYSLLEQAWAAADLAAYRQLATPLAEKLLLRYRAALEQAAGEPPPVTLLTLPAGETGLLIRLAKALEQDCGAPIARAQQLLELAALAGVAEARFELGLRYAHIDGDGDRRRQLDGPANYKKAIPWLLLAGRDGVAQAWHALSHIYAKSEFSQRDLPTSRRYLERAAEMGLVAAQFEYAQSAWRNRRDSPLNDVRALYWWRQAAARGHAQAQEALRPFAPRRARGAWAEPILDQVTARARRSQPFLCARLELAAAFGLSRPEALLIDMTRADHGHCLEVDIGEHHARSKRRLVLVENDAQRDIVKTAARLFADIDGGYAGPEGNYRQRQYRLKNLVGSVPRAARGATG